LAYHYLLQVQRDVQAICAEAEAGSHPVLIINDTLGRVRGKLLVRRAGESGVLLESEFEVEPNGKVELGRIPDPEKAEMWQIEWVLQDGRSYKNHYLAARPFITLEEYRRWMELLSIETVWSR
jgi:hypothetical protein